MITKKGEIVENTVIFYDSSVKVEEELVKSILEDYDFSDEKVIPVITENITNLPLNEQIHAYHYILADFYELCSESKKNQNVENLLSQGVFVNHRKAMMLYLDQNQTELDKLGEELGIKLLLQEPNVYFE